MSTNHKYFNGNDLIRALVMIIDFIIASVLLIGYTQLTPQLVPAFFHTNIRTTVLIVFFSLCIAQYFYSTIIYVRQVKIKRFVIHATKLALTYCIIMFGSLRIIVDQRGMFRFFFIYLGTLLPTLLISRFIERVLLKRYRAMGRNTRSVVFVGSDPANLMIYREMVNTPSTGYVVLGYYANDLIAGAPPELKHLGDRNQLLQEMQSKMSFVANATEKEMHVSKLESHGALARCDEIIVSLSHDDNEYIAKVIRFCDRNVIHFYYAPRLLGNFRMHLKAEYLFDQLLFTNRLAPLEKPSNRFIKRLFDIVVSSIVCLCMLPFLPIIALLIKIQSPGPLFFKQARTGLNGNIFHCLKFRSMHVNKEADTAQATKDDPRKFAFGNFMRKTNLDEFPQFINVLKGDMSIVGPRPHMLHHTEMYSKVIDQYMVRHFSKPGITGWAQVTGYRGETKELWQMEERIHRDIWYIENWSFALDLHIIFMTAKSIFFPDKMAY